VSSERHLPHSGAVDTLFAAQVVVVKGHMLAGEDRRIENLEAEDNNFVWGTFGQRVRVSRDLGADLEDLILSCRREVALSGSLYRCREESFGPRDAMHADLGELNHVEAKKIEGNDKRR